jgi:hypothetical protein
MDCRGSDWVRGSLNWGPVTWLNGVYKTYGAWKLRRGSYAHDFHTYTLEWQEDFMLVSLSLGYERRLLTHSELGASMLTLASTTPSLPSRQTRSRSGSVVISLLSFKMGHSLSSWRILGSTELILHRLINVRSVFFSEGSIEF